MPNLPYGPDGDHSEVFRSSGASLLLELGRLVAALLDAAPTFFLMVDSKRAKDLREQIGPKVEAVKAFFEENPKAAMAKHVLTKTGGMVSPKVSLAVSYLGVCTIEYFEDAVPLMRAARAVSLCGDPAAVLEARRFLAALGTHGMIAVPKRDGEFAPRIRLASPIMYDLLGGERCLPKVDHDVFQEVADERRRRIGHSTNGSRRPAPVLLAPSVLSAKYIAAKINAKVIGLRPQIAAIAARLSLHLTRAQALKEGKAKDTPNHAVYILGSSGTGKTYVCSEAARAAGIPYAAYSALELSKTGYVGADAAGEPFYFLTQAADGSADRARFGALCLDEWKPGSQVGDSAGVGTVAVQQEMLSIMSGSVFQVGGKKGAWGGFHPFQFNSLGTFFFFAGHLPGLATEIERSRAGSIGFTGPAARGGDSALRDALIRMGFIEEWLNRLSAILILPDPSVGALYQSVSREFLDSTWNCLLERRGLRIELTPEAAWMAAGHAAETRMFYRGPKAVVGFLVQDLVMNEAQGTVRLGVDDVRRALDAIDGKECAEETAVGGQEMAVDDCPVIDVMA